MQFKRSVWTGEKETRAPSPPPAATVLSGEAPASKEAEGQLLSEAEQTLRSPRDAEEKREEEEEEEEEAVSEEEEAEDVAMGRPKWQLQAAAEGAA